MSPARLGVTAQCPSHTFAWARPPHAPCHPQSRADTVQNNPPSRPPRTAAAPRRRRPVPQPALVSVQVSRAPQTPSTPSSAASSRAPSDRLRRARCREDAQPGGSGTRRQHQDGTGRGSRAGLTHPPPGRTSSEQRSRFEGRARPPYLAGSTSFAPRPTRRPGPARRALRAGSAACAPFE